MGNFLLVVLVSLALTSPRTNPPLMPTGGTSIQVDQQNETDQDFWFQAMQDIKADIREGGLAETNKASAFTCAFAKLTVCQSQKMMKDVDAIGQKQPVMSPTLVDPKHTETARRLAGAKGKDFDKAYKEVQADRLAGSIKLYREEIRKGINALYRNFAKVHLPEIRQRLKVLQGKAKLPPTT